MNRVKISPKILDTAVYFYNISYPTILPELLQNARRAGATRVDIAVKELPFSKIEFTLTDNGCGIFKDGVNLTLGDSNWSPEVIARENPAGCGLFSLSQGCTIESNGLLVSLDLETFKGKKDIKIDKVTSPVPYKSYTQITFREELDRESLNQVISSIEYLVQNYPIPVYLNGQKCKQEMFLESCTKIFPFDDYTIGFDTTSKFTHNYNKHFYFQVNYFGILLEEDLTNPYGFIYPVKVDVHTGNIKFTLPQRDRLVRDSAFHQMIEDIQKSYYRLLADSEKHIPCISDDEQSLILKKYGIDLEAIRTYRLSPIGEEDAIEFHGSALDRLNIFEETSLLLAFLNPMGDPKYWNLPYLDKPPKALKKVSYSPTLEVLVDSNWVSASKTPSILVDGFRLTYKIKFLENGEVLTKSDLLDLPYATTFYEDDYGSWVFEGKLFIHKTMAYRPPYSLASEIAELVTDVGFEPSSSGDEDEERAEYFNSVEREAISILQGEDARRKLDVDQTLSPLLPYLKALLKDNEKIVISQNGVTLEESNA